MQRLTDAVSSLTSLLRSSNIEPVNVGSVAEAAWQQVDGSGGSLSLRASPTIYADRQWLSMLFESLCANAVDHSRSDVTLRVGSLDGGFYVSDDGPGIPADRHDTVFESGYTTLDHGSGYGLRVVRHVARAHDWDLSLTESADGGVRYEFTRVTTANDF